MDASIQTVTGPIAADAVGFTLTHEHVAMGISGHEPERQPHDHPWEWWDVFNDEDVIADELDRFKGLGGSVLVDLTDIGLGRDPLRLRRISERTGVRLVAGCGWYRGAVNTPESFLDRRTVTDLSDQLVREIRDGIDDTDIRAGIIGEIGTEASWLNAVEERVFRAAARASRETGLAIVTHAAQSQVGRAHLALLVEEGVSPERVVVGHVDSSPYLDYHLALLDAGANIGFDLLGVRFGPVDETIEPRIVDLLLELLERGHAERILLSQAVALTMQRRAFGGNGYTYLQETFLPLLRTRGVSDEAIDTMTIHNPRRLLQPA